MSECKMDLVQEMVGGEPYEYYPLGEHVVAAPGVCGGRPTFKYTRIEITGTLDRLAAGETVEAIVAGYQGRVSREALLEAVRLSTEPFARDYRYRSGASGNQLLHRRRSDAEAGALIKR